jgi:hypothetical protein
MNILRCPLLHLTDTEPVICPGCHSRHYRKHGSYSRKGFHLRDHSFSAPITIQRYRCRNKDCPRCTFSVLPPMVLRYCRFFWPCLLFVLRTSSIERSPLSSAWNVSRGVARRAAAVLTAITSWVSELYQEVTDGGAGADLERMVKIIIRKIGRVELSNRWYRHHYPLRFPALPGQQHNLSVVNMSAAR